MSGWSLLHYLIGPKGEITRLARLADYRVWELPHVYGSYSLVVDVQPDAASLERFLSQVEPAGDHWIVGETTPEKVTQGRAVVRRMVSRGGFYSLHGLIGVRDALGIIPGGVLLPDENRLQPQ